MMLKKLGVLVAIVTLLVLNVPLGAQGSLSNQVLQLLSRTNTWTGSQTFQNLRLTLAAVPVDTTARLYADGAGNLYWDGGVIAGSSAANSHALLSSLHTDSVAATVVRGDLIVGNSTPAWARFAKGTANQVLSSNGTDLAWSSNYPRLDAANTFTDANAFTGQVQITSAFTPGLQFLKTDGTDQGWRFEYNNTLGAMRLFYENSSLVALAALDGADSIRIGKTASTFDVGLAVRASAVSAGVILRESYTGNDVLFRVVQNSGDGTGATVSLDDGSGVQRLALTSNPAVLNKIELQNAGTAEHAIGFVNTGGTAYLGQESSAGGAILGGSAAYAMVLRAPGTTRDLQFGTNNAVRQSIDAAGATRFFGISGQYATYVLNTAAAGSSYGLLVDAGGNSSDQSFQVRDRVGSNTYFFIRGDGATTSTMTSVTTGTLATQAVYVTTSKHNGTGTVTDLVGLSGRVEWTNTGGGTNAYGLVSQMAGRTASSGTYTNGYGFYVGTFGAGITNKYSFYSSDATASLVNAGSATIGLGLTAGSGSVAIINSSGKIPALTSTYFASLDGSALTGIVADVTTPLANNTYIQGKTTDTANHPLIGVNASDVVKVGDALNIWMNAPSVGFGTTQSTFDAGIALRASAVGAGFILRESYAGNEVIFDAFQNNGDGTGARLRLSDGAGNTRVTLSSDPATTYAALIVGTTRLTGGVHALAGSSTSYAKVGGVLFDHFVDAQAAGGAGETDLYSDSIGASALATNGDKIIATYAGTSDVGGNTTLKIYFGGTATCTGAAGAAGGDWSATVTAIRVSASVVRVSCDYIRVGNVVTTFYTEVTGLTLTNAQIIKITGTATGTSSVIAREGYVEWKPAA